MENTLDPWLQIWPAPAKINRFLHIIGRRKDGYHCLQSVFQFVDFCDELKFTADRSGEIKLEKSVDNVLDNDNLVIKAAKLLQQTASIKQGVCIQLKKKIPLGAGLGGGSSDAATTLLVLNSLWKCGLTIDELAILGMQLGADVPFFILGKNAFVEGIGEKITPIEIDLPWLLLAIPQCHIATESVFSEKTLRRNTPAIELSALIANNASENSKLILLKDFGHNDCQQTVSDNYPLVAAVLNGLYAVSNPRLTGTGSCVFAIFNNQSQAEEITVNHPQEVETLVARTLQTSPLHTLLGIYLG